MSKEEKYTPVEADPVEVQRAMDAIGDALQTANVSTLHAAMACSAWVAVFEKEDGIKLRTRVERDGLAAEVDAVRVLN